MKVASIALFLITASIVGASMAKSQVAQSAGIRQQGLQETVSGTGPEFRIVGNAKCLSMQWHIRIIAVLLQPESFTTESLRSVFLHLSEEYPAEDVLEIDALSNDSQVETAKDWFAEIQSFPFGNVIAHSRCASPPDPLTAIYFRSDGSERFVYYPATSIEDHISVELKRSPVDCAPSGDTPTDLVDASMRGCEEVVQELIEGGANPNIKSRHGGVALVEASFWGSGHPEIVKLLLDAGADINQTSSSGWTALIAAVFGNRSVTIELLLSREADVNLRSEDGRSALTYAVLKGNKAVLKKLLARGADITVEDGYGKTALMIAEEGNNENLIRLLRKAGARR